LNMNPNCIFHISVFVHFCEAFVLIKLHWILFRKFFCVKPQQSANDPRVVGGANIRCVKMPPTNTCRTSSSTRTSTGWQSNFIS
jgi:hypothetical protein